jgi:alkylation response protein AidB-like acyl-CoA dehydrogenase
MDFTFSEEQQMLLETTRRFIAKDLGFETRRHSHDATADGFSRAAWQGFADLGLLALQIPEQDGGLGGTPVDTMLVMTALGEGLALEPYLASAVLATQAIAVLGNPEQRAALLPALAAGSSIAVLAHDEAATRFDWQAVTTRAVAHHGAQHGTYLLDGHKSVIAHGPSADILLVTARLAETDTLAVFAVPSDSAGVHQSRYSTVDGVRASDIHLEQVRLPASALLDGTAGGVAGIAAALAAVLDIGLAAVCAEAVGALDRILAATVEYTRTRKQFGVPIASFQALQHRMADMVLHIEQARSMSYLAAVRCQEKDPAARGAALSAAKVVIGQACRFVGQQAVQLHGGMGVSDELDVSHYFKRLMAIELQFGSTDWHLERYAAQL